MGHVFDFNDARAYAQWATQRRNSWAAALENQLVLALLKPAQGESVLDIGCGAGISALSLLQAGTAITCVDPSPYMLDLSHAALAKRVDLYRGFAEDLPFDDNSFNHACFFLTLEYVEDPAKAIAEACRVAKDRLFIGFLNRFALQGVQRRLAGLFNDGIFNRARFYGIWELKRMVRQAVGPVPVAWRTVCQLPGASGRLVKSIESSDIVQRFPFGSFVGMVVTLMPRLRTRPLAIRYKAEKTTTVVAGSLPAQPLALKVHDLPRRPIRRSAEKAVA